MLPLGIKKLLSDVRRSPQQGTFIFMSRNTLKGIEPQTCLDDLESFYYVLLYIARIHMDPELAVRSLPPPLDGWDDPRAWWAKQGFISLKFDWPTDPRLGKPVETLVGRLHSVFKDMLFQKIFAEERGEPPPAVNHDEVYELMLSHVRDAINELNQETEDGVTTPHNLSHEANTITQNQVRSSSVESWPKIKAYKKIVKTLATNRARRTKASLRVTDQVRIQVLFEFLYSHGDAIKPHRFVLGADILPKRNEKHDIHTSW